MRERGKGGGWRLYTVDFLVDGRVCLCLAHQAMAKELRAVGIKTLSAGFSKGIRKSMTYLACRQEFAERLLGKRQRQR